jgi:alpha-beta hydrolase superfamily lysophospholipase
VQAEFVDAGGTRLFVRRWGEKDRSAVFYWHGGGGGSGEWPHFAPALERAGYSVYAPDAPGYGESPPIPFERARAHARFRAAAPSAQITPVPASHGIFTEAGEEVRRALLD